MNYKKTFSKNYKREFAQTMEKIRVFCHENGIQYSATMDSYYFSVDGQAYRVSNHSVEASNQAARNAQGDFLRDEYHPGGRRENVVYIHAGKTRIIEIYKDIVNGYELDGRGNRK